MSRTLTFDSVLLANQGSKTPGENRKIKVYLRDQQGPLIGEVGVVDSTTGIVELAYGFNHGIRAGNYYFRIDDIVQITLDPYPSATRS